MPDLRTTIEHHARERGSDCALSDRSQEVLYRDLPDLIDLTAGVLQRACPGSAPIGLVAENSIAWALIDLALGKLERPAVPLPPFFSASQRAHALVQTGAAWLLSDEEGGDLVIGERAFRARGLPPASIPAFPAGTAKITYTSGSTGQPKGVCLSQDGLERVARSLVEVIGAEYAGTHLAVLPLGVLLENAAGLYTTLLAGGRYHVPPQAEIGFGQSFVPDFALLTKALRDGGVTSIIVVPEILRGILKVLAETGLRLPAMKLVAVGGARVAPALLSQAEALGLPVFQGYGLSEAGSVVTLNTPRFNRPGSVGRALPHAALSLAGNGEIRLRRPGFLGYVGSDAAPDDYGTGDLGAIDDDGFVYLTGRSSNVLITGFGRNVSPEWVESELIASPHVGQAFVFGDGGAALGALIVPSAATVSDAEIEAAVARANAALPDYARVKHWAKVFPFLPSNGQLTGNGRLQRAAIASAYAELTRACLASPGQYRSFFERLIAETETERAYLTATQQIRDGLDGRISLQTYLLYLAEAYQHVRHTVPLLERVRDLLPPEKAWLREAADAYIAEEAGHEEWILDDIANAGGDAAAVRHAEPRHATELMVAYAYDFVTRINPVGFFGMVFVLEGTSTQLATRGAQALMTALGLGENCFRYLTSHGAIDLSHMQFLQGLLNRVDDRKDQADIVHMARRMFVLFADLFRSIPHESPVKHAA